MKLEGSCHCGAVSFSLESKTPYPYDRCYCSICRKTAGSGGYAVNIMGEAKTLALKGAKHIQIYQANVDGKRSSAERHFCRHCGSYLYISDPRWPDLVHPFAAAIDTPLPTPPAHQHIMLSFKAAWVELSLGPEDAQFDGYPELSIAEWHAAHEGGDNS